MKRQEQAQAEEKDRKERKAISEREEREILLLRCVHFGGDECSISGSSSSAQQPCWLLVRFPLVG